MKNILLIISVYAACLWGCSHRQYAPVAAEVQPETGIDEEGAVQEPAWTYFERLSIAFGGDTSCVGITDSMTLPDWYSGCFVNSSDRLTINVVGDSLTLRRQLEQMLHGNEFDIGKGLYSKNEQRLVRQRLRDAVDRIPHQNRRNMSWNSKEDGTIDIFIQSTDPSVIDSFRTNVYDSPLLRFQLAPEVGIILQ